MKLLVIPDIHNRIVQAQSIMEGVAHDKCILLGDYFDGYGDNIHDASNTAAWLRDFVLPNPKNIPLIGNHDVNYFWNYHPQFRCSGYRDEKYHAIRKEINQDHVRQFKFFHIEDNWCFSHAGLTVSLWKSMAMAYEQTHEETRFQFFERVFTDWVRKTVEDIDLIKNLPLLGCGWDRGGDQQYGGIIWVDWRSFASIQGVNQMVGHTPHKVPEVHVQFKGGGYKKKYITDYLKNIERYTGDDVVSLNFAMDTHSDHYAVVTDGKVEVYDSLTREPILHPTNEARVIFEVPLTCSGLEAMKKEEEQRVIDEIFLKAGAGTTVCPETPEEFLAKLARVEAARLENEKRLQEEKWVPMENQTLVVDSIELQVKEPKNLPNL